VLWKQGPAVIIVTATLLTAGNAGYRFAIIEKAHSMTVLSFMIFNDKV